MKPNDPKPEPLPHQLLWIWQGVFATDSVTVDQITGRLLDLHRSGWSREELMNQLQRIEGDLIDGRLTVKRDAYLQILNEIRQAQAEVMSFTDQEPVDPVAPPDDSVEPPDSQNGQLG